MPIVAGIDPLHSPQLRLGEVSSVSLPLDAGTYPNSEELIIGQIQNRELREVCKVELIQRALKVTPWKGYVCHNLDIITSTMAVMHHSSTAGNASPVTWATVVAPCFQAAMGPAVIQA
jgi:hypothetical protein